MNRGFEGYLINVGLRCNMDYTYTDDQLYDNVGYFRKCYDKGLSAYKALLFLNDYIEGDYNI